jgi:hypothetical protein
MRINMEKVDDFIKFLPPMHCDGCDKDMEWVIDYDGSINAVCHTCKYILHNMNEVIIKSLGLE